MVGVRFGSVRGGGYVYCVKRDFGEVVVRRLLVMRRLLVLVVMMLVVITVGSVGVPSEPAVAQATPKSRLCDSGETAQFTDVRDSDYAAAYILCMRALGLSQGRDGGYKPDRELNRGQMATFLIRLWTEHLNRQCPTGVKPPFTDTQGTTHKTNIDCLFRLGITQGTSATTYSPQDPLTASQITRFLYRTYQTAGGDQCTETDGSQLDQVAECLVDLKVAPTTAEATSTTPVTRAQMGVYMIGLWHNLTNKGLPPTPPQLPTTTTSGTSTDTVAEAERLMAALVNELREREGLHELVVSEELSDVARGWSNTMLTTGEFKHNPVFSEQYPPGSSADGENIAFITGHDLMDAIQAMFYGLVDSPGHYANMVHPVFTHLGIGVATRNGQNYVTQNFARYTKAEPTQPDGKTPPQLGTATPSTTTTTTTKPTTSEPAVIDYGTPLDKRGIWVTNTDGTSAKQIAPERSFNPRSSGISSLDPPVWSPDGSQILYQSRTSFIEDGEWVTEYGVSVVDADGTNPIQIASKGYAPRWSPDGSQILYQYSTDFTEDGVWVTEDGAWVVDADGTNPIQIASGYAYGNPASGYGYGYMRWSPDGSRIAYIRLLTEHRNSRPKEWEMWVVDADGTNPIQITTGYGYGNPRWSPDGSRIAYTTQKDFGADDMWVVDADGTNPIQIASGPVLRHVWSPDGSRIAYSVD